MLYPAPILDGLHYAVTTLIYSLDFNLIRCDGPFINLDTTTVVPGVGTDIPPILPIGIIVGTALLTTVVITYRRRGRNPWDIDVRVFYVDRGSYVYRVLGERYNSSGSNLLYLYRFNRNVKRIDFMYKGTPPPLSGFHKQARNSGEGYWAYMSYNENSFVICGCSIRKYITWYGYVRF